MSDLRIQFKRRDRDGSYWATVADPKHPQIETTFVYQFVGRPTWLVLVGQSVMPGPGAVASAPLSVKRIRELPLVRWDRAARAHIIDRLRRGFLRAGVAKPPVSELAAMVEELAPGLSKAALAGDARAIRSFEATLRLARVATEYRDHVTAGFDDPAQEIAKRHRVSPSTARSWIYRARLKGLLGPATGTRAGEGLDSKRKGISRGTRREARS